MNSNKSIIFDVQILQTPAADRGMGQYIMALLESLHNSPGAESLILLLSSRLKPNEKLKTKFPKFRIASLPLNGLNNDKNTLSAQKANREILDHWIAHESLEGASFIMGSVFQVEIYPVFPERTYKFAIAYDVIPLQLFKQYKPKMRWDDYLTRFSQLYLADKLLCISKTTSDDLQVYCSVLPEKLTVINGGPGNFENIVKPTTVPEQKFILMPTGNDVRKNNRNAVLGFEHFRQSHPNYTLVISSYFSDQEKRELSRLSAAIVFTDSVTNDELAWYYKNCEALLFPSLYEGLGMPLIEAMKFGKPIAASGIQVFTEISQDAPYYFDPHDPFSIAAALMDIADDSGFKLRLEKYKKVVDYYTWDNTAAIILGALSSNTGTLIEQTKPKIAVVGPYSNGVSAVGKFMAVLHPALQEYFDIEYFFEPSPIDQELRPDILSHISPHHHISALTDKTIRKFDAVIYHIGNSNHHTLTAARAMLNPGIVIFHDLNLENIFTDLKDRRIIDEGRYKLELQLNKDTKARFIYSIASRQRAVIAHSEYAKDIITKLISEAPTIVKTADLCVDAPKNYVVPTHHVLTIGLAGILANIKGLKTIEQIARNENFKHDKILLFGLNFAEKGMLEQLRALPNVEIATNLSDYEFQQNIKRMSVFVNYREAYQGEASYSTLESMQYGVPVIVRGDFGWYAELPDDAVIKVSSETELVDKINILKNHPDIAQKISEAARQAAVSRYNQIQYARRLAEIVGDFKGNTQGD